MSDIDRPELSEYGDGQVDTIEALLIQTAHTTTQTDILMAAFDSHRIPDQSIHRARERVINRDE